MKFKGVIACGHRDTARAAEIIFREGGNAFDAAIAAYLTACVSETVLASFGGGGFFLAHKADGESIMHDFFAQTPINRLKMKEADFFSFNADFGAAEQEFYIGLGAAATPGAISGIFSVHRDLCTMPMSKLVEPAINFAREGYTIDSFQASFFKVMNPIFALTPGSREIFGSRIKPEVSILEGEYLRQPELADTLEAIAKEGERLFYEGEIAQNIVKICKENGGCLNADDLLQYKTEKRKPHEFNYKGVTIISNPPPAIGGVLISFALKLIEEHNIREYGFGSAEHINLIANTLSSTNASKADICNKEAQKNNYSNIFDHDYLKAYKKDIQGRMLCNRGTSHVSVLDKYGNMASLTISNGEGCGHMIPKTGIMLNNFLGEEDLNPNGFYIWPENSRMTSTMAPTIMKRPDGRSYALGTGGCNRIRSAVLQIILNLIDFEMPVEDAVEKPRIHMENGILNIEEGYHPREIEKVRPYFEEIKMWKKANLYFGGVHSGMVSKENVDGKGDSRRGGFVKFIE
jgi:gamma-glutamyltranspeptidase/glutathione hydrolase